MGEPPCFAHLLDDDGRMPEPPRIRIARVYGGEPSPPDEVRVLVDRVWPRGVRKDALKLDAWLKELAPSSQLRRWFGHDPSRWREFEARYRSELAEKASLLAGLAKQARGRRLLLLYSARDEEHNQAVVLKDVLEEGIANG